jgi:hypothetical protein
VAGAGAGYGAWDKLRLSTQTLSTIIPQAIHHLGFLMTIFQSGDSVPSKNTIETLNARIVHLEKNRRYIQNGLEMVLSLEDFLCGSRRGQLQP